MPVTRGVPQGAIQSPLLFCIYLNDLPLAPSSCKLESYVDDSKLFSSSPLIELDAAIKKLEQDLLGIAQWCCENHLLIRPEKTKLLFLGARQILNWLPKNPSMSFLSTTVKLVASAKNLGVILDPHLIYDYHISKSVSSCFSKLHQLELEKAMTKRHLNC